MVGMSGKVSEPRRGQSSQQKKTAVGSVGTGSGSNKTQPPPEALHVANILGDGMYPSDFGDKIAQVMSMLPACSEDEVCIALHDYDFDTNKAISALLDSDTLTSSQGEWTTQKKSRRSKVNDGGSEFIIAPGDNQLPGRQSGAGGGGRGTNRAASQSVREGYGGNVSIESSGRGRGVSVTGEGGGRGRGRGRGKGRAGGNGRGRSSSGRRDREDREMKRDDRSGQYGGDKMDGDGKREERGVGRVDRGSRARNRGQKTGARNRSRIAAASAANSEKCSQIGDGNIVTDKIQPVPIATETWDDLDPQPSTEWGDDNHHHYHQVDSLPNPVHPDPIDPSSVEQTWDSEAESKESQPIFPEAYTEPVVSLDTSITQQPITSLAQPTTITPPLLHQPTPGSLLHQPNPGSLPHQPNIGSYNRQVAPVVFQTNTSSSSGVPHSSRHHSRHKRLARSQIPSQPVEMPKGTYPEISELGIAFGGMDIATTSTSHTTQQEGLLATPTTNEPRYTSDSVSLTYSTPFTDDSGVISIATSTSYSGTGKKLEAPPGLPHPRAPPLPHSITPSNNLPHSLTANVASGSLPHSVVPSGSLPHSVVPSGSLPQSVVPSGSLPRSVVPSGSLPHSVVPSGSLSHSVVSSGSLQHSIVTSGSITSSGGQAVNLTSLTTTTVPSSTATIPTTTISSNNVSGVGKLGLPTEPISQSSLLSTMDLTSPSDIEHNKSTFTTAPSASHQLTSQSFSTVSTSSVGVGGVSELLSSQTIPTTSIMATPTSKSLTVHSSSHHHGNQQQLQAQLQGSSGSKHTTLQQQQQQQQQAMIYPYMLQHPMVMPMSAAYYDPNEMSRYQASVSMAYYQHPTTSDPAMATGMSRDHGGSGFGSEGATGGGTGAGKYGGRSSDLSTSTTPANPPHSQQQGVQQGQMSHAAMFNPYYGGNVIYHHPMYPGYGMPGFSTHSLQAKPSGGSSYPGAGVNSYQAPAGGGGFGYEDISVSGHDYKMYGAMGGGGGGGSSGLGKHTITTTGGGDISTVATGVAGYKQHAGFDSSKTGANYSTYSMPQGGYGFIPTGVQPVPLQMPPSYMPGHEGGGGAGSGRSQKHSNKTYGGSHGNTQLWSQQPNH